MTKVLLYGFGNPGRRDDGLGIAFVDKIEQWALSAGKTNMEFESNYQLNIEDAEVIAGKDLVIFADASREEISDYCVSKVDESSKVAFTSHEASPGYVVKLCKDLFGNAPPAYLVHIRGYDWDFAEGLSEKALENLDKAVACFLDILEKPETFIEGTKNVKFC
ncbi:MAG: hydrogenase maturation protease [Bacteroidetes bacterium]|nr:hydrogenase maturation protease [Bacteroidota bacterium]